MRNVCKLILLSFLFLIASTKGEAQETSVFLEAQGSPATAERVHDYERWSFSIADRRYEIDHKGRSVRTDDKNRLTNFRLRLGKDETVVRVIYYYRHERDLLLLYETETGDAGAGAIVRFDGDTLKVKWQRSIPGFNIANGLIEGDSVYLGAIGFAAKIDLTTGSFLWKHDDLYRKYKRSGAFNIFEVPEVQGADVIFTENDIYTGRPNIIKFNKVTGTVIKVSVS